MTAENCGKEKESKTSLSKTFGMSWEERLFALIVTGGCSLLREENREYLKQLGVSVYLKASIVVLYQRVLERGFPSFLKRSNPYEHFVELARERFPIYQNHCHHTLETENLTESELVNQIGGLYV